MGIIKQGILGGFSGKVGSVVGTSWKGRAVMKAMPLSVANPRTAKQVQQRSIFSIVVSIASDLLSSIVKPLNDRFAGNISGYNAFVKRNINNSLSAAQDGWLISSGKMNAPKITDVQLAVDQLTVEWDTAIDDSYGLDSDKVYIAVIDPNDPAHISFPCLGFSAVATRDDGTVTVDVSDFDLSATGKLNISVAFLRADGTVVSNTGLGEISLP